MKHLYFICLVGITLVAGCRDKSVNEPPPVLDVNAPRPPVITTNADGLTNAATNTPARP